MGNSTSHLITCLGEILFDLLSDNLGASYKKVSSWTSYIGGAPANVAIGLSKLSVPVSFIGRIGEDEGGKELFQCLKAHHILLDGVQWDPNCPTRKVYVERNLYGERNFAGFGNFKSSEFADTNLNPNQIPWSLIAESRYLVLGTLLMAYPRSYESVEKTIQFCLENKVEIIMDVNWRPVFWENEALGVETILKHIGKMDMIKFSKEEAELLYKSTDLAVLSKNLPKARVILVTDGENGCHYKIGSHVGAIPSFKVRTVDTTGAGDSFLAGFIYQILLLDKELESIGAEKAFQIIQFASAMGALTTTGAGAILPQPNLKKIQLFLASMNGTLPFQPDIL
jgi:fructokinase